MASIEKRTTKEGTDTYRVKIRLHGFPPVSASFERMSDAKRWAQKVETELREGRYFQKNEASKHTLGEAIDRYTDQMKLENPGRLADVESYLAWWKKRLGAYLLSALTKAVIVEAREALMKEDAKRGKKPTKRSNSTVNRYVSSLRTVLSRAAREWEWALENPIKDLSSLPEPKGRNRYLNDEERERLLQECRKSENSYLYAIVILGISSGARKSEITEIQWDNVDLERKIILLPKTKNKETRVIYLHGKALHEIMKLHEKKKKEQKFVFPSPTDEEQPIYFRRAWNTALRNAKISNFRFHDLRHTAASYLAMNGANMKDIAELLGHKSLAMTNRYAHLSSTHMAQVVGQMNERIFGNGKT